MSAGKEYQRFQGDGLMVKIDVWWRSLDGRARRPGTLRNGGPVLSSVRASTLLLLLRPSIHKHASLTAIHHCEPHVRLKS